jgi:hypothetical protein
MKNNYLIFLNPNDVYSNLTTTCTREELNYILTELELMESNDHYSECAWIIFENGIMIQG